MEWLDKENIPPGMGPRGLLWRWHDIAPWSSLQAASPWGAERLAWPVQWHIGHGQYGSGSSPWVYEQLVRELAWARAWEAPLRRRRQAS